MVDVASEAADGEDNSRDRIKDLAGMIFAAGRVKGGKLEFVDFLHQLGVPFSGVGADFLRYG